MARVITPCIGRRTLLAGISAATTAILLPDSVALAQQQNRVVTPRQTEGPFYPVEWSGDIDNDLVVVTGEASKAQGQILHLEGRVLDVSGLPFADAAVEIWQCDANGIYRHPRDVGGARHRDAGFQGRGRTRTDAAGRYSFRTIRPVAYPGRTPHIHFNVTPTDKRALITQMYVFGEKQNARDGVLNGIRDPRQRDSVIVRLDPAEGLEPGALAGTFDIVLG
jgi:protocatechuate 3,4-dioxygenase, beta subunit